MSRSSRVRRLVFALVPVAVLLLAATALLSFLESRGVIRTTRKDDRVAYPPDKPVGIVKKDGRRFYRLADPEMLRSSFPVKKPANGFRIIVTGGSFAMGTPYVHQYGIGIGYGGIPDWLAADLSARYPSLSVEVINAGGGGQNSYRVADIVRELLVADPDLFIVATGNNEGYVPVTRFNRALHRWSVYRAMKRTILPDHPEAERPYFASQDEDVLAIERAFRSNIDRIVATAKERRVPLLLATLPIHLTYNGVGPQLHGRSATFPRDDPQIEKGRRLLRDGRHEEAIDALLKSRRQDHAAFWIAQCLEGQERFEEAKAFYRTFVQHVPLNRTRPSYNEYVRKKTSDEDLLLADLEALFENLSPTGIPDATLFHDYCHLTWKGYFLCAREIARVLIEHRALPGKRGEPLPAPSMEEMIEKRGWQRLYTDSPGSPLGFGPSASEF